MNPQTKRVVGTLFDAAGEALEHIGTKVQKAAAEAGAEEVEHLADKLGDAAKNFAQRLRARKRRFDP